MKQVEPCWQDVLCGDQKVVSGAKNRRKQINGCEMMNLGKRIPVVNENSYTAKLWFTTKG